MKARAIKHSTPCYCFRFVWSIFLVTLINATEESARYWVLTVATARNKRLPAADAAVVEANHNDATDGALILERV